MHISSKLIGFEQWYGPSTPKYKIKLLRQEIDCYKASPRILWVEYVK